VDKPRLAIPLTNEQLKQIKIRAAEVGLPMAEIGRRLMIAWLVGDLLTGSEIFSIQMAIMAFLKTDDLPVDVNDEYVELTEKLKVLTGLMVSIGCDGLDEDENSND